MCGHQSPIITATNVKVNLATIIDDGEVKKRNGQALYKRLKDLYQNRKKFVEMSIGYLFRYANVDRYIGGSQTAKDSVYFHSLFGTFRILTHCKNIQAMFKERNAGTHANMYTKLIGNSSIETFCRNFEITVLVDTKIPSTIVECCIYEALKARVNSVEIRKQLLNRCKKRVLIILPERFDRQNNGKTLSSHVIILWSINQSHSDFLRVKPEIPI